MCNSPDIYLAILFLIRYTKIRVMPMKQREEQYYGTKEEEGFFPSSGGWGRDTGGVPVGKYGDLGTEVYGSRAGFHADPGPAGECNGSGHGNISFYI